MNFLKFSHKADVFKQSQINFSDKSTFHDPILFFIFVHL